jgi:hypothetical protein
VRIKITKTTILGLSLLASPLVNAADFSLSGDAGVGTSNNIGRTATNEQRDTISELGASFLYIDQSRLLSTDVRGDLAYLNYANSTYGSELLGNAGAALKLELWQDRIHWSLDDSFGQTRRDLFTVDSPLNRENINSLSTGPDFRFELDSQMRILANARYGRVDYQVSPLDSQRYSGELALERNLSNTSRVSLGVGQERVEPQSESLFSAYDRQEAHLEYALDGARTKGSLDIGVNRITGSAVAESSPLLRLEISRKIGDLSTISLRAGHEYTDPASAMGWSGGEPLPVAARDTQSLTQTTDAFLSQYARLDWTITGRRTLLAIGAGWYDETYKVSTTNDRKRYIGSIRLERSFTELLRARASYSYTRADYDLSLNDSKERDLEAGVSWRLGRHLFADISAAHYSYATPILATSMSETRIWAKLRYDGSTTPKQ